MAAADSFVGAALSPSPYSEAMDHIAALEAQAEVDIETIKRLQGMVHAKSIQYLDGKTQIRRLERDVERLVADNAWLRELLTNLSKGAVCGKS